MQENSFHREVLGWLAIGVMIILAVLLVTAALGSWFVIDQGERGVVLRTGKFQRVAEPGLGFKWPIVESVVDIDVREGKRVYDKMTSYSQDLQLAEIRVAINYRVDISKVAEIYERYGSVEAAIDRVITPRVADEVKVVFGQFNAQRAVSERNKLGADIESQLRRSVLDSGLILLSAQLEEIDFSKAFETSIEDRMKAEVEVAKLKQNHEREKVQADIVRTKANGEADAIRARALAEADAIKLRGDAEASAIKARAAALQQNAGLIELVKAEKWNGQLPTTMLPGSATPLLSIK